MLTPPSIAPYVPLLTLFTNNVLTIDPLIHLVYLNAPLSYLKLPTLATHGLEEPFFQLCCCVSFLFWQEIDFGFTHYLCT